MSRIHPLRLSAQDVEAVAVEGDLLGAGGDGGEVAQPGRAELEGEGEDLGAAAATGAFGAVRDVSGAAFDPSLRLLLERFAGGGFGVVAGRLGAVEQALPGRAGAVPLQGGGEAALDVVPQLATLRAQQ